MNPDAASLVERLVWHHDQPFGDSSALPTYLLSELTRKHVTVALCGDGGDELFAGYERFAAGAALAQFQRFPKYFRDGLFAAARTLPPTASRRGGPAVPSACWRVGTNRCSTHTCRGVGSRTRALGGDVPGGGPQLGSMITADMAGVRWCGNVVTGCSC